MISLIIVVFFFPKQISIKCNTLFITWHVLRGVFKKFVAWPWRRRDTRVIQLRILQVNIRISIKKNVFKWSYSVSVYSYRCLLPRNKQNNIPATIKILTSWMTYHLKIITFSKLVFCPYCRVFLFVCVGVCVFFFVFFVFFGGAFYVHK